MLHMDSREASLREGKNILFVDMTKVMTYSQAHTAWGRETQINSLICRQTLKKGDGLTITVIRVGGAFTNQKYLPSIFG